MAALRLPAKDKTRRSGASNLLHGKLIRTAEDQGIIQSHRIREQQPYHSFHRLFRLENGISPLTTKNCKNLNTGIPKILLPIVSGHQLRKIVKI